MKIWSRFTGCNVTHLSLTLEDDPFCGAIVDDSGEHDFPSVEGPTTRERYCKRCKKKAYAILNQQGK